MKTNKTLLLLRLLLVFVLALSTLFAISQKAFGEEINFSNQNDFLYDESDVILIMDTNKTATAHFVAEAVNGLYGVALYDQESGTFLNKDDSSAGTADRTFRYGPQGNDWLPAAGLW